MVLFGGRGQGSVVQQVLQMRQQGTSDNQIVQALQRQGVATQEIFDALSQADLTAITAAEEAPAPQDVSQAGEYPPAPGGSDIPEGYGYSPDAAPADERIQQVAEAIINEKWEELAGEVQKVVAWKEEVETELQKLQDALAALKEEFRQLHQGVLGKVGEYDERMRDVSADLKAVQKVFKDVIPSFTENVAELSRVAKAMKKRE